MQQVLSKGNHLTQLSGHSLQLSFSLVKRHLAHLTPCALATSHTGTATFVSFYACASTHTKVLAPMLAWLRSALTPLGSALAWLGGGSWRYAVALLQPVISAAGAVCGFVAWAAGGLRAGCLSLLGPPAQALWVVGAALWRVAGSLAALLHALFWGPGVLLASAVQAAAALVVAQAAALRVAAQALWSGLAAWLQVGMFVHVCLCDVCIDTPINC
jgi:hypothetical protein